MRNHQTCDHAGFIVAFLHHLHKHPHREVHFLIHCHSNATDMVLYDGVSVAVHRSKTGAPYVEYTPSHTDNSRPTGPQEVYIEPVLGENFYIIVKLEPNFDFKSYPSIQIAYSIDGGREEFKYLQAADVKDPVSPREQQLFLWATRFVGIGWMECGFMFDQLQIRTYARLERTGARLTVLR